MRRATAACAAALSMLVFAGGAGAVVNGEPDGNGHPNVGALLAPQAYSDGTWASCTGTLISPTVFLTAAHCEWDTDRLAVTFASTYVPGQSKVYWGTWHADPLFSGAQGDPHDAEDALLIIGADLGNALGLLGDPRVARGREHARHGRILRQTPAQRVFATTSPHHEDVHPCTAIVCSRAGPTPIIDTGTPPSSARNST